MGCGFTPPTSQIYEVSKNSSSWLGQSRYQNFTTRLSREKKSKRAENNGNRKKDHLNSVTCERETG